MIRILSIILGITTLAIVATGFTEASMALSQHQTTSPEPTTKQTTVVTPKATTTVTPATTPTVAPAAPVTPVLPTATVNGFVHIRASATTSSVIITDLNAGDVVSYASVDSGLWQAVTFQGTSGYIYKSYLNY